LTTTTLQGSVTARLTDTLRDTLGPQRVALWLGKSARLSYDQTGRTLTITLPHRFALEGVRKHCGEALRAALNEAVGPDAQLDYRVDGARFESIAPEPVPAAPARPAAPAPAERFRHRLDEFIVGPSNQLAFSAAERLADPDADPATINHPLFLYGGCGLGKTHLLQGICQRMLALKPTARVRYTTGEQFTNDYIQAVRTGELTKFRAAIRRLDLLAVDDVHFLSAKEKTQQEFLHTFNRIELEGARVVMASDCHPKEMKAFSEALVNRCVRGLVASIKPPDAATRLALVRELAARRGLDLAPHAAETLARLSAEGDGSVRELEGHVMRLHAMSTLPGVASGPTVSAAMVAQLIHRTPTQAPRQPVRFDAILDAVVAYFGVSARQVLGSGRSQTLVLARSVLIHLARTLTPMSYPEIAGQMGRKGHSTILTSDKRVQQQMQRQEAVLLPGAAAAMTIGEIVTDVKLRIGA